MSKMIQLRNVPDDLHHLLKSRAALAGMSLSDYLIHEIRRSAERPTREDLIKRLEALPSIKTSMTSAEVIRAERDRR